MRETPNGSTAVGDRTRRSIFGPAPATPPGEVVKQVVEDATTLIKAEIDLARAELKEGVQSKAIGAGMFAAAAALVAVASLGLLITIGFVLAEVAGLPGWASALIVSLGLILMAVVLALIGKKKLSAEISVDTMKQNVQEDIAWIKQHLTSR